MIQAAEFDRHGCYSYRKICSVAIPILLSLLMEHIIGMTDTAFLGRVSETALGASALGTVYFMAFFVLGAGFSFGSQILIARRNGEKNFLAAGQICYAGVFFLALFSLILILVIKYLSPAVLPLMVKSPDICNAAIEYLNYRTYGLFFAFITTVFRAFYVGISRTKILTISSVIMVLANIVFNYGLIFGKYGMPEMGIAGAALASSIAEAVSMVCYIIYTLKYTDLKKYGFNRITAIIDTEILKKVFSVSIWMMVQPFFSIGVWFFFFIAVEQLGERSLAVVNVVRCLTTLSFIIIQAFATAANSLVSTLTGEKKSDQVWRLIRKIMLISAAAVMPFLLFMTIFPEISLRIYTDNPSLIADSVDSLYVVCLANFLQIGSFILFNAVSGTGAVKVAALIETVNLLIYAALVYLIIIRLRPVPAIAWLTEISYQVIRGILCFTYLFSGRWRNMKI